jgi:glycosyltransferase 2 family protein
VDGLSSRVKRRLLLSLIPSVIAIGVIGFQVNWGDAGAALSNASPAYLLAGFLFFNLGLILRTWRWSILLRPIVPDANTRSSYGFFVVGYMVNMLLPFRAGDVVRAAMVKRRYQVSGISVLATIAIEKILDLAIAFFLALFLLLQPELLLDDASVSLVVAVVILTLAVVMWGMTKLEFVRNSVLRIVRSLPGIGGKLERFLRKIVVAMEAISSVSDIIRVVGASILVWIPAYFVVGSFLRAAGLEVPASAPVAVIVFSVIGLAIPAAPGNIGVAHLLYAGAVILYGVGVSEAAAFAVIMHAVPHLWTVFLGAIIAWRMGVGIGFLSGNEDIESSIYRRQEQEN